jgi:hypothetical protein
MAARIIGFAHKIISLVIFLAIKKPTAIMGFCGNLG